MIAVCCLKAASAVHAGFRGPLRPAGTLQGSGKCLCKREQIGGGWPGEQPGMADPVCQESTLPDSGCTVPRLFLIEGFHRESPAAGLA